MSVTFEDAVGAATVSHVGALSQVTFTFSAAYALTTLGGKFIIRTPEYYRSGTVLYEKPHYTDDSDFQCAAAGLNLVAPDETRTDLDEYVVDYTVPSVDEYNSPSKKLVLVCQNWRNPIVPESIGGFKLTLTDTKRAEMGVSPEFEIDASKFAPYPITPSAITFGPEKGQNTVQSLAKYTLAFTTPVPLEVDVDNGCFLMLKFPDDFGFSEKDFTTFLAQDDLGNRFLPNSGYPEDLKLHTNDFKTSTFVFQGCQFEDFREDTWQATSVAFEMSLVRNPNSTRTSGGIEVVVAKDAEFKKKITSTSTLTLAGSRLAVAQLTDLALEVNDGFPLQQVVQEPVVEMQVFFKTVTTIPGTEIKSTYRQAAHIFFPSAFIEPAPGTITATWGGTDATVTRDKVGDCQEDGICYIISIASATEIVPGLQTILVKNGLKNPISVAAIGETGTLRVRTMLKRESDPDWADIDSHLVASPYHAIKGTIDAGTIVVEPPARDPGQGITALRTMDQTYATN